METSYGMCYAGGGGGARGGGKKHHIAKINARRADKGGTGGVAHGRTRGNRAMDAEAAKAAIIPTQFDSNILVEHKLIDPGEKMSRQHMKQRTNVENDGKPKKGRYYEHIYQNVRCRQS